MCVCVCVSRECLLSSPSLVGAKVQRRLFLCPLFFFIVVRSGRVSPRNSDEVRRNKNETRHKKKRPHRRGSTRRTGVTTLDRHWSQSLNDVIVGRSKSRKGAQRLCRRPHNVVAQDGVEPPHWAFIGRNR